MSSTYGKKKTKQNNKTKPYHYSLPRTQAETMPSQKAIISTALAKASTAVQLDNSHYYSGARKYYIEACELLEQVISRVTNEPDREKLERVVSLVLMI